MFVNHLLHFWVHHLYKCGCQSLIGRTVGTCYLLRQVLCAGEVIMLDYIVGLIERFIWRLCWSLQVALTILTHSLSYF